MMSLSKLLPHEMHRLPQGNLVRWVEMHSDDLATMTFHHAAQHAMNLGRRQEMTPMGELAPDDAGILPDFWILHTARCGSTLVAQMLGADSRNWVLSEPTMTGQIIRYNRTSAESRDRQLRWTMNAGAPPEESSRRYVVKADWTGLLCPELFVYYQDRPGLIVYREPLEQLVSLLRKPSDWMQHPEGRQLFNDILEEEAPAISESTEWMAWLIGVTMKNAAELAGQRLRPLNYSEIPQGVVNELEIAINESIPASLRERMMEIAKVDIKSRSAKNPFRADTAEKQAAITPRMKQAVDRYARPWFEKLESIRLGLRADQAAS